MSAPGGVDVAAPSLPSPASRGRRRPPAAVAAEVTSSTVTVDRRLGAHATLAAGGLALALVTGAAAFAAAAAPAAALAARGVGRGRAPGLAATVVRAPARVLAGEAFVVVVDLVWSGRAEVACRAVPGAGTEVVEVRDAAAGRRPPGSGPVDGIALDAVGGVRLRLTCRALRWGNRQVGRLEVRARRPGGAVAHDVVLDLPTVVRALPPAARLDALLHPAVPRAAAGAHPAPRRGPGTDFADLRPYRPGDRERDVSWAASARSEVPWVVVHHPERTGCVVLCLDGFTEGGVPGGALERAARVVWSLARHHLAAGDRVGLVSTGASPVWLAPVAGRRARWQVLDALLRAGDGRAAPTDRPRPGAGRRGGRGPDEAVPADAFVVGVSPLQSDAFVAEVVHHRRVGRPTAVVVVETADLLDPPRGDAAAVAAEVVARRLWRAEVDLRRGDLSRAGVRTVLVADDPTGAVRALADLPHRATAVRG